MLRKGSTGDDVGEVQDKLSAEGHDCGTADGVFGSKTEGAVCSFQGSANLGADGSGGPKTDRSLRTAYIAASMGRGDGGDASEAPGPAPL
ncbi:MAG: peptidoglycan-binding protein [Acidimicrobiia bacterium]